MLSRIIEKLVGYAEQKLSLPPRDAVFARNTLLMLTGLRTFEETGAVYEGETVGELLGALTLEATAEGLITEGEAESLSDRVMGALMLPPSEVERRFSMRFEHSPEKATEWLYRYLVDADYVKKERLDLNPRFTAENGLIVTINRAKPEFRDPKKAVSGNSVAGGYPSCSICRENEGFHGRDRRTLRTVSVMLGDEKWFWQFSPYGYFRQHGIAVNEKHIPMHVDRAAFEKLLDFVDAFPHYFIGCNAPLPRIGGSVLAHDHFQGGGETLPLFKAKIACPLYSLEEKEVEVGVVDWYGTVVRVTGRNREQLVSVCERIRAGWEEYEDRTRGLIPRDGEGVHHAVSPTVVMGEKGYEINLILRSNITSERYPDGVFHAHPEYHVIKKESIGLIEAQGLFILPGRLVGELRSLRRALLSGVLTEELRDFRLLFSEIMARGAPKTEEEADRAIAFELGDICRRILLNTAVFETPQKTAEFLKGLGFYE